MSSFATARRVPLRTRTLSRTVVARAGLAAILCGGVWIALGSASNDSIVDTGPGDEPGWLAGPLHGLAPGLSDAGFSVALIAMLAGYLAVVALADRLEPRLALAAIAVTVLALTLAPPILSSDIFGYVAYARLGVLHHLDPYTHGPIAAPHDPILGLVYWQHPSTPYGPLFTLGSYALAQASLPLAVWSLKVVAALAFLAALAFTWRAAQGSGRSPLRATAIVGGNPLLLVYGVGGGHNDVIVLAAVTAALALLVARRTVAAGAAMVAAVAIKVTAGLALPFALLGARRRGRLALAVGASGVAVAILTLAVFGPHVLDTVGSIATGRSFEIAYSGPDLLGRLTGTGIDAGVRAVCAAAVVAAALIGLWSVRRGGDWIAAAGWTTLVALVAIPSFVPWYIAWLLPFAALAASRRLASATLVLTAAVVATHLPLLGFGAYQ
jgi:alpha-1,6-mannosyltransferase